jgi:lipopolysaccharide transport system permease protein
LILTARDWLTGFPSEVLVPFLLVNAIVLVLLLFMGIVFRLAMPMLIERMGS